jgi:hypothetical protein
MKRRPEIDDKFKYIYNDWRELYKNQQNNISDFYVPNNVSRSEFDPDSCPIKPTIISTGKFAKSKKLDENVLRAIHSPYKSTRNISHRYSNRNS